ncbi:MAG: tRNA preQ1(34) S-adenosylmethionine ribosyltransferase-isomerase QueA [Candidatus Eremiobacteraeota bacterium]|nr:tRNA preQ1(34) S-adenosylmethionine ribosyltransferase-isomerase QueA [Candidatus Eremiobacteraeota bacterium]
MPPGLIATVPAEPADAARLMVVGAGPLRHRAFLDFPELLRSDDVLVINETRVVRARLSGTRAPGGGAAEILLLRPAAAGPFDSSVREWRALVKPGRRLPLGARVHFGGEAAAEIVHVWPDGSRTVRFEGAALDFVMERYGELPLPPYVGNGNAARAQRYQTIFARVPGSVAAPTASLHFTPRVIAAIRARGTTIAPLVLDVGLGTFKPMEAPLLDEHVIHAERYFISEATARAVNSAKREGRRVIAAGTTTLRALEASAADNDGAVAAGDREATLFITPGFPFRVVDALLTNFHLPASTLLVLVSAFGGYERTLDAYRTAIIERYRFYSFGDAMFVYRSTAP